MAKYLISTSPFNNYLLKCSPQTEFLDIEIQVLDGLLPVHADDMVCSVHAEGSAQKCPPLAVNQLTTSCTENAIFWTVILANNQRGSGFSNAYFINL